MLRNIKGRLENTSKYNQQLIDVLKELQQREHVNLAPQIKRIESTNNRINDTLRSTNQLIDALSSGGKGSAESINVLRSLPALNSGLGSYRAVSYTHLTLPTTLHECRSRWSPYH